MTLSRRAPVILIYCLMAAFVLPLTAAAAQTAAMAVQPAAPASQPTTAPAHYTMDQLFQAEVAGGRLQIKPVFPLDPAAPPQKPMHIQVDPGQRTAMIRVFRDNTGAIRQFTYGLNTGDPANLHPDSSDRINFGPGRVSIARQFNTNGVRQDIVLNEMFGPVQPGGWPGQTVLHVTAIDNVGRRTMVCNVQGTDFADFCQKHPAEVEQYLKPIFNDYGFYALTGVTAEVAFQVFVDRYPIDPAIAAAVADLLAQLDSDRPENRDSATEKLKAMGQSAIPPLLQADRTSFSPEQQMRVDAILARWRPLPDDEAAKKQKDPNFLMGCLLCEDRVARVAAIDELQKLSGLKLDFDPDAAPHTRAEAVAKIRKALAAMTQATTSPSSGS